MAEIDDIQRIAARGVRFLLQRCPWGAGHAADMQQEAILALLTAQARFDHSRGTWDAYARGVVEKAGWRYLKKARAGWQLATFAPASSPGPEEELDRRRAAARVRSVLNRLDYHPKKVGVASALGEDTPRELAQQSRVPVKDIYYARAQLVRRAAKSLPMRALLEELRP